MKNTTAIYDNTIDYLFDQAVNELKPKRKFKQYALYDNNGNLLAIGRHNEVVNVLYPRYTYRHIFDDVFVFTGKYIDKDNNIIE
jgi:hypothetical protein